jgi:hypothetical protein
MHQTNPIIDRRKIDFARRSPGSPGSAANKSTNWTAIAKFDGEFAQTAQTYAGTGTLRYSW